jgi:7-cyano-7-deazaguanine synthase
VVFLGLSGGPDSVTLAYYMLNTLQLEDVEAIYTNAGVAQTSKEYAAACYFASLLGINLKYLDMSSMYNSFINYGIQPILLLMGGSGKGSCDDPQPQQYITGLMSAALGGEKLYTGIHATDISGFPNILNVFSHYQGALRYVVYPYSNTFANFTYEMPFQNMAKSAVLQLGSQMNIDYAKTWSCLGQGQNHCGLCDGCLRRKAAFAEAQINDPTIYDN